GPGCGQPAVEQPRGGDHPRALPCDVPPWGFPGAGRTAGDHGRAVARVRLLTRQDRVAPGDRVEGDQRGDPVSPADPLDDRRGDHRATGRGERGRAMDGRDAVDFWAWASRRAAGGRFWRPQRVSPRIRPRRDAETISRSSARGTVAAVPKHRLMVSLARGGGVRQGAGLKRAHALPPGWRRSGFLRALAAALVAATLGAFTAGACTVCDGGTG